MRILAQIAAFLCVLGALSTPSLARDAGHEHQNPTHVHRGVGQSDRGDRGGRHVYRHSEGPSCYVIGGPRIGPVVFDPCL